MRNIMDYMFIIDFVGDAAATFARAKAAVEQAGGKIDGNPNAGTVSGKGVKASYMFGASTIRIVIQEKPWYAPVSMVEKRVREFFAAS